MYYEILEDVQKVATDGYHREIVFSYMVSGNGNNAQNNTKTN
jgi:hypothetical protein